MGETNILASFRVTKGREQDFEAARKLMAIATRAEPGCELYEFYVDAEGTHYVIERFEDEAAFDAHRNSGHMAAWRTVMNPLFEEPPHVRRIEPTEPAD